MSDTDVTQIQGPRDLFFIRSQLAGQANPLRAKIVLFSLLYRPFSYNSGDWSTLKQQDLGEFIRRVYNKYATLEELKRALTIATAQLDAPDECDHAAAAICNALKPYYSEAEPVTGDSVSLETDDADNSQTWDIPIGISLKDLDSEDANTQGDPPTTGISTEIEATTEIDRSAISQQPDSTSDLLTTGISNATTMALFDTEIDLDVDDKFDEDQSTSDHSRWLDAFDAEDGSSEVESVEAESVEVGSVEAESDALAQSQPTIERRKPEDLVTSNPSNPSNPSIVATPHHDDVDEAEPEPPQASSVRAKTHRETQIDPPIDPAPPQPSTSKRNGRRTALAQLLTQHVNSRDEVDAIVQRYSKTLTEQVTSALDDLEGDLADCLGNCEPNTATQIAGEALGRVLLSVSESIVQMRQALESIPGVDPIATDWPQTRPPQTQAPQTSPALPAANPAITADPSTPAITAIAVTEATVDPASDQPNQSPKPNPSTGAIDPVQQIRDQFDKILAKRDMSVVVKQRHGCIHIIAEANPLPERAKLTRFVSKALKTLDLPPIASLRLHGRRTGARAFDWSEDLPPIG